jgi:hypothetical protein
MNNTNDYAVAKSLNQHVGEIILLIVMFDAVGLPDDYDINELNRMYVLLVNELQKLYNRNPKLSAINPKPIWEQFDVLKTSSWDINEYLNDPSNDVGQSHNARVEKLSIIEGLETPDYTSEQKKLLESVNSVISKYSKVVNETNKQNLEAKKNDWQIPEYSLAYSPMRGTILINNVYQLNKRSTNDSSNIDKLLAQGMKQPNKLFTPVLNTSKSYSSIISNAGFTPTLRQLFFPVARNGKGVVFRPNVLRAVVDAEGIDTAELDLKLKELGTVTEPKSSKLNR